MHAAIINVTLDVFCTIVLLFLMVYVRFLSSPRQRLSKYFIFLCMSNIAMLLGDIPNWLCEGYARPWYPAALWTGTLVGYLGGAAAVFFYTRYVHSYVADRTAVNKTALGAAYVLCGSGVLCIVMNLWNGMYYALDAANVYHRGDLWWLSQAIPTAVILLDAGIVLRYRRYLRSKDIAAFLGYEVLPLTAIIIQGMCYGLALTYPAVMLSILIIFLNVQSEQALELKKQEHELEKGQIAITLSQIQPHFLYNSLLGIKQLCDEDPQSASDALEHFSYYLRGNMYAVSDSNLIPFEKELEHLEDYLYLEKMRFEERVSIQWEIEYTDFMLPPLTVQPIVENAIRHGITKKEAGGTIIINSVKAAYHILIIITDNGVGFDMTAPMDQSRPHIGIENVRKRIETQCRGRVEVSSQPGKGTTVTIILPGKEGVAAGDCRGNMK